MAPSLATPNKYHQDQMAVYRKSISSKDNFFQGHGFLVIITDDFVLIMELRSDQLLHMFVKRLSPMGKTRPLFVNHLHYRISSPINNLNNILVCLHTIHHKPLENGRTQPFLFNNYIQLPPKNALNFHYEKLRMLKPH